MCGGTTHTIRLSAILSGKTTADSLLRSSLSGGTTFNRLSTSPLSIDETPANYSRYMLLSTMSGGTTLQPLYLAELPYLAVLDYNRVSAAHLT
jgi:hypothetical protein